MPIEVDDAAPWGWIEDASREPNFVITNRHLKTTCSFVDGPKRGICRNLYAEAGRNEEKKRSSTSAPDPDIVEISDDPIEVDSSDNNTSGDHPNKCSPGPCKSNPQCLNHLGQAKWEDESKDFATISKNMSLM